MLSGAGIRSWYQAGISWCAVAWWLLLGLLALSPTLLVVGSVVLLGVLAKGPDLSPVSWYRQEAARRMAARDFATARLCYARLLQKSPNTLEYKYGLAITLSKLGENAAAEMLMRQLAPEDAAGYPTAQLEVARELLSGGSPTPDAIHSAEARLKQVLKVHPSDPQAHSMLAVLYSKASRWDLVKQHMAFGGTVVEDLALPAARVFAAQGDWVEANIWGRRAATIYADRVKLNLADDESRMKWAQATLVLKNFEETLAILEAGWKRGNQPMFRGAIGEVSALWLNTVPTMDATRKLAVLENGLQWDSQNEALLQMLLDPATANGASDPDPALPPARGAAARAMCQSVAACRRDQPQRVRSELKLAMEVGGPAMLSMVANVACIWAYGDAPDSGLALRLSTALLEACPDEPIAQRAQGLILARQERWAPAVECLEAAVKAMPGDKKIHSVLATAYDKLGRPALADAHRNLARPTTVPATAPAR